MGSIVTQSRSVNKDIAVRQSTYEAGVHLGDTWSRLTMPGSQVTTSYRSGTEESDVVTKEDLKVFQPARFVSSAYDTGHEFQTTKSQLITTTTLTGLWTKGYNRNAPSQECRLSGAYMMYPKSSLLPGVPSKLSLNQLMVYGSRAINATIPTRPQASLSQATGELIRDGIPALPAYNLLNRGLGKHSAKDAGSEYLNIEFGWKPLVSDVTKLLHSVTNSAAILRQFRRDSGRIVRRGFTFPEMKTVFAHEPYLMSGSNALFPSTYIRTQGFVVRTDVTTTNVWYKGAYSYYLDVGDELMSRAEGFEQKANHLLGLRLTPDVLYDLAPWSWLLDWFTTVGTSLSNVSALQSDGLVIRYGYLMRHSVVERTERSVPLFYGVAKPVPISTIYRTERKERWKATPYGFGLDFAGFSLRQWAILAALGMTKAPGIAR